MRALRSQILFLLFAGSIVMLLNQGLLTLDARFHYSVEEARYFLSSLNPSQQRRHFWGECADLFLFIPAYSWLLLSLTKNTQNQLLRNFVALAAAADILETATILYCLQTGELAPHYLPEATTLKWLSLLGFSVLFLGSLRRRKG